jgi:hypothetical protein
MAEITLRVLEGADRGRVYENLATPITIGREEGNSIQLNDERISRFHVKVQDDQDKLVLTDLESTNGSKVNGQDCQVRILRYGDLIAVGRSVLLFGSREQIAERLAELRRGDGAGGDNPSPQQHSLDFELNYSGELDMQSTLHTLQPPDLPDRLSPGQAAQLYELLEYVHQRIRDLLNSAAMPKDGEAKNSEATDREKVQLDVRQWQSLLDLQARLSEYIRRVSDPGDGGES